MWNITSDLSTKLKKLTHPSVEEYEWCIQRFLKDLIWGEWWENAYRVMTSGWLDSTSIHKIMDAGRRSRKLLYNSGSHPNDDIRPIIQATKGLLNTIKLNYSIL